MTSETASTTTPQWVPLSRTRHADAGWQPLGDYRHAADHSFSPLVMVEISSAVGVFPLAFVQYDERYELVALHSAQPGVNLYVDGQGRWLASYVPAWQRSYPFRLFRSKGSEDSEDSEGNENRILCVDEASAFFRKEAGAGAQRFFDDESQPGEALQKIISFHQQYQQNRQLTDGLVQQLAEAGVIQPWVLELETAPGEIVGVGGVFQVNEVAVQQLPGDTLSALARSGALAIAYAQVLSSRQIHSFEQRRRDRAAEQAQTGAPDLEQLLSEGDSDTLSFGF